MRMNVHKLIPNDVHVLLALLPHRRVRRLCELNPLDLVHLPKVRPADGVRHIVVLAADQQSRNVQEVDLVVDPLLVEEVLLAVSHRPSLSADV